METQLGETDVGLLAIHEADAMTISTNLSRVAICSLADRPSRMTHLSRSKVRQEHYFNNAASQIIPGREQGHTNVKKAFRSVFKAFKDHNMEMMLLYPFALLRPVIVVSSDHFKS
jgi:hypothetical protein